MTEDHQPDPAEQKFEIELENVPIQWSLKEGNFTFFGLDSALFWTDPSLLRTFLPLVEEVGTELFRLLVAHSSTFGTREDYHHMIFTLGTSFPEGFLAWGRAVSIAGWGCFELPHFSLEERLATVVVRNPWEVNMQRNLTPEKRWGCPFIQGKIIGIFSQALGVDCWADETCSYDPENAHVVFQVHASRKTIPEEIRKLRQAHMAEREMMLAATIQQKTAELTLAQQQLRTYSRELEKKVAERTEKLVSTNQSLMIEVGERRQAEERLSASEENLRTTLNSIGDGVISVNRQGLLMQMNPVAESLTGWSFQEARGRPLTEVFRILSAQSGKEVVNPVQSVLDSGKMVGLANHTILVSRDGRRFQIADSASPIRDELGKITGVVLVFRDVTGEYQLRENLLEWQSRYEAAVRNSGQLLYDRDLRTREVTYGGNLMEILGYSFEEMSGGMEHWVSLIHPDDRTAFQTTLDKLADTGQPVDLEVRVRHKNGDYIQVRDKGSFIQHSRGRLGRMIGFVEDITRQKKNEEELLKMQRLKSIGTLAGGIAHDFNNILMGFFGSLSMAKEDLTPDHPAYQSIEEAERSLKRATRLAGQLLTFAKGGEPLREDLNLGQLAEEVVRFDLSGSNVLPVFSRAGELWAAHVDKGQMQQIFSNLAINAAQAMPGGGKLFVRMENEEIREGHSSKLPPGPYIKVSFRDEGVGIPEQNLNRIFDPYFSTKPMGSGLGLATIYSIVARHRGLISVESTVGVGTTFFLYLPASTSPLGHPSTPEVGSVSLKPGKARVLVMDDEETIRKVTRKMLERCGHEVEVAEDGKDALQKYQQSMAEGRTFDLVIMDLTIPGGMGGGEAIKLLLELDPQARAIVSSGYAEDRIMANFADYGFKGIVAKPYTKAILEEVVNRLIPGIPDISQD